jgi:tRNA 2-selenouridine synthase
VPAQRLHIREFIQLATHHITIDVRSEAEYAHAHIPNAVSIPLFNNDERKIVGTTYKQQSREEAIKIGLDFFGPKMKSIVTQVETLLAEKKSKIVLVHCWRGGMRSAAIAWLLDMYGFKVYTLAGGYKAFRNWVLQQFTKKYTLQVLGGYTGSAKTETLQALAKLGETVIDLEAIASHKGSAFGSLGLPPQPSAEYFENNLALQLYQATNSNAQQLIWIEGESQRIGSINQPINFYNQLKAAPYILIEIPFDERLNFIVQGYGHFKKEDLINAIIRIKKKLGGLETKNAINFLLEDNVQDCFAILLRYYDKLYNKSMFSNERRVTKFVYNNTNYQALAAALLSFSSHQTE